MPEHYYQRLVRMRLSWMEEEKGDLLMSMYG